MDSDIWYSIENVTNDVIFDCGDNKFNHHGFAKDDNYYHSDNIRTYVFKDFTDELYFVDSNGVPMNVMSKDIFHVKNAMKIETYKKGVIIIKNYNFRKVNVNELHNIIRFLTRNGTMVSDHARLMLRDELNKFLKNNNLHVFTFRMVSFISERDLLDSKKYFDYLLDGYFTKDINNYNKDFYNDYNQGTNSIEISLKNSEYNNYYLVIKDNIIPLYTSDTVPENIIKYKRGRHVEREILLRDNLEAHNIFTSEREAKMNIDSYKKKDVKLNLEEKKLDVEDKKLNVELCKLASELKKLQHENTKLEFEKLKLIVDKEKMLLDYKKSIINYKTEVLKKELNTFNIVRDLIKNGPLLKDVIKSVAVLFKK